MVSSTPQVDSCPSPHLLLFFVSLVLLRCLPDFILSCLSFHSSSWEKECTCLVWKLLSHCHHHSPLNLTSIEPGNFFGDIKHDCVACNSGLSHSQQDGVDGLSLLCKRTFFEQLTFDALSGTKSLVFIGLNFVVRSIPQGPANVLHHPLRTVSPRVWFATDLSNCASVPI